MAEKKISTLRLADVDASLHQRFKAACYLNGETIRDAVLRLMAEYIANSEKKK